MKNNSLKSLKSKRGFTLIEIICVVVLMGILGAVGLAFMRDTAQTGRENAGITNANELNTSMNNLRAAGAVFSLGTTTLTTGSNTTSARIGFAASPATAGEISAIIAMLRSADGIKSFGNTASLTNSITAASYTATVDAGGFPTFTFTPNAAP